MWIMFSFEAVHVFSIMTRQCNGEITPKPSFLWDFSSVTMMVTMMMTTWSFIVCNLSYCDEQVSILSILNRVVACIKWDSLWGGCHHFPLYTGKEMEAGRAEVTDSPRLVSGCNQSCIPAVLTQRYILFVKKDKTRAALIETRGTI